MSGKANEWTVVTFEEIENWREAHHLSKFKLATLIGITNSSYHNWRRGQCAPNQSTQRRIRRMIDAAPPISSFGFDASQGPAGASERSVAARRLSSTLQAIGLLAPDSAALAAILPAPAILPASLGLPTAHQWADGSSARIKTSPTSAPRTGKTTMNGSPVAAPLDVGRDYPHLGAETRPVFAPADAAQVLNTVCRLASAALASGMDISPHDLPTFVGELRRALT